MGQIKAQKCQSWVVQAQLMISKEVALKATGRQPGPRPTQKLQNEPYIGPKIPKSGCASTAWMHPRGHVTHVWTHPYLDPWMHP